MGQLPICCCSKAKKFNDFSRACVGVCVCKAGAGGTYFSYTGGARSPHACFPSLTSNYACRASNSPICFSTMPACLGDSTAGATISATLFVCRITSQSQRPWCATHTELSPTGSETWGTDRQSEIVAAPNSHRPVQKLPALIGNPRSSQQFMGQLPISCCSKAKKFNDFSRARGRMCVRGEQALLGFTILVSGSKL